MLYAKECLDEAGIVNRATVFKKVPSTTFAVYFDYVDVEKSPDLINRIYTHDETIELYSYIPDPVSEQRLEDAMNKRLLKWSKDAASWLESEQMYITVYSFSSIEKKEG